MTLVIEMSQARITTKQLTIAMGCCVVGDLAISVFNNVQLARRVGPRKEAAVEDQGLACHER